MLFHFKDILQHFTRVLVRRQLMKRQMFVRKLMFLVCCSFLVIWSSNVLNTKCKLNCQNEFFGKPFLKSGNTGVYFMFWLLRFIWRTFDMIIDVSVFDVVKGLRLSHKNSTQDFFRRRLAEAAAPSQRLKIYLCRNKSRAIWG